MTALFKSFDSLDMKRGEAVVVAVSGGSDSLALLLAAQSYIETRGKDWSLHAVTVDHGLREASAGEAELVAALCAARGISHRTMRWTGRKPATGIMAAAREARMALLSQCAAELGARVVLVGHTADDQAETIAMRRMRGEGRGIAGIALATLYRGRVWFVRPLLGCRRQDLRDWLGARQISWIDDPSNENRNYERVATRKQLAGTGVEDLLKARREAMAKRLADNARLASFCDSYLDLDADRRLVVNRDALLDLPHDVALLAIKVLSAVAGGATHLPDEASAERLLEQLVHGRGGSLSRAVIAPRQGLIAFTREQRGLPKIDLARVDTGKPFMWDGRFEGTLLSPASGYVAAHGRAAEPALFCEGEPVEEDVQNKFLALERVVAPWAHLLPSFDLTLATAIGKVIGARIPLTLPLRGHNGRQGLTE